AAVLREVVPGRHQRTAVVAREVAHVFALEDWIACVRSGRVAQYEITNAGRSALKRMLARELAERRARDGEVAPDPFRAQHAEEGERTVMEEGGETTKIRFNLAESPLTMLGRRRGADGAPFLSPVEIEAGERLREDFERAQLGPRVTQNWEKFLASPGRGQVPANTDAAIGGGSEAARSRVAAALKALGPGLSDIAFRCCCFLEGLETAEKRLGWSARSGKVVLRIALQQLAAHYGLSEGVEEETRKAG
ncbi:MAG: DUF6456 domain-containing protein, partial [Pseudomonadota bacterium]